MAKRLSREEKKDKAIVDLINQMFIFAGHAVTFDDIKDRKDAWYSEWTITIEQYEAWMAWGRKYLQKNFRYMNKTWATREMAMIGLNWGLKFDRMPTPEDFDKIN